MRRALVAAVKNEYQTVDVFLQKICSQTQKLTAAMRASKPKAAG